MGRAVTLACAISREEAVEPHVRSPGQRAVGLGIVDELADARLAPAGGEEALLEVKERVLAAAGAAAQVELLEALLLPPASRLEQDEIRRARLAAALARPGDVIVEPRRCGEAEGRRRELVAGTSLDEHDPVAQPFVERLPVSGREEVELVRTEAAHRRVVEGGELVQAGRGLLDGDLEAGRPRFAHLVAVLWMEAGEEVELRVERPGDRLAQRFDVDSGRRLL